jgi:hypothetical protein
MWSAVRNAGIGPLPMASLGTVAYVVTPYTEGPPVTGEVNGPNDYDVSTALFAHCDRAGTARWLLFQLVC